MRRAFISLMLMGAGTAQADAPQVAVDIAPLHGLVSQVMEGVGTPELIIPLGASPHSYAMRPSEARALSNADMVVWTGPELSPWFEEPMETLAPDAKHLTAMEVPGTTLIPVRQNAAFEPHDHAHDDHGHGAHEGHDDHDDHAKHEEHDEHDHEEHAHDDHGHDDHDEHAHDEHAHDRHTDDHVKHAEHDDHDHGHGEHVEGMDPHVWLDPRNASVWLSVIAEELAEIDPENADIYRSNAERGQQALADIEKDISDQLSTATVRDFIVFHDSYHYFEARFDVEAKAGITLSDDGPASAAQLAEVRDVVAETGAACVLAEPGANEGLVAAVSGDDSLRIVTAAALGVNIDLGPKYYEALLKQISEAMTSCFEGKA